MRIISMKDVEKILNEKFGITDPIAETFVFTKGEIIEADVIMTEKDYDTYFPDEEKVTIGSVGMDDHVIIGEQYLAYIKMDEDGEVIDREFIQF